MSDHLREKPLLLIGAGKMAEQYCRVLELLQTPYEIVGRGSKSAKALEKKINKHVWHGGLQNFIQHWQAQRKHMCTCNHSFEFAIVATPIDQLVSSTERLIDWGIKNILLEKPGGLHLQELCKLMEKADRQQANIYIAYNRRFLPSVIKLQELLQKEALTSVHFNFTELNQMIKQSPHSEQIKRRWLLANSTHVIDLVFYLSGESSKIKPLVSTVKGHWHPAGAVFAGSGETIHCIPYSYHANWLSPGGWEITFMTEEAQYRLRPLEDLSKLKHGGKTFMPVKLNHALNHGSKPGLYQQVRHFLHQDVTNLLTLQQQVERIQQVILPMVKYHQDYQSE